jgi:hypothetical protein
MIPYPTFYNFNCVILPGTSNQIEIAYGIRHSQSTFNASEDIEHFQVKKRFDCVIISKLLNFFIAIVKWMPLTITHYAASLFLKDCLRVIPLTFKFHNRLPNVPQMNVDSNSD